MRCPYCGFTNADRATYCVNCGNAFVNQNTAQRPAPSRTVTPVPPTAQRPAQRTKPAPPPANLPPLGAPRRGATPHKPYVEAPPLPVEPTPLAAPGPFPPKTLEQLQALEKDALAYTVENTSVAVGQKKIVRITYEKGVAWQQMATLAKAFREQRESKYNTIIIQGVLPGEAQIYAFTNGQLVFDKGTRLGSQLLNRYMLETGNGYASDAVRVVLTEESK